MAISCDLNVDNTTPAHGDLVTFTYEVFGNDAVDPTGATIRGRVVVGGTGYDVSTSMTLPGSPAQDVLYSTPTYAGLTFTATANPAVFTSVIP